MSQNQNENIKILDILRRTPGARIGEIAKVTKKQPEVILSILNDPDFRSYLKQTESEHLSQLRTLHQIAMDRILEILDSSEDPDHIEKLAKWLLNYSTKSILSVSELNVQAAGEDQGEGSITINQVLGRDPFASKGKGKGNDD